MVLALATPKFVWYLMRGSGFVVLALFTVTTVLGVLGVSRWQTERWPRFLTENLHRNVSLVALCFLGVHVTTALVDQWVGLKWIGAVVPFVSTYRPLWVGLGVVAADLLLAVIATSLLRRHIGYGAWRFVHWGAWLMWPLAVMHAFGSGTDSRSGWGLIVVLACVAAVALAATYRVLSYTLGRAAPSPAVVPLPTPPASAALPRRRDERRLVSSSRPR